MGTAPAMNLPQARLLISGPSRRRALNQRASLTVACRTGSAWVPDPTESSRGASGAAQRVVTDCKRCSGPPEASGCRTARSLQQHKLASEHVRSDLAPQDACRLCNRQLHSIWSTWCGMLTSADASKGPVVLRVPIHTNVACGPPRRLAPRQHILRERMINCSPLAHPPHLSPSVTHCRWDQPALAGRASAP